ncbi:MAG: hypothetical protein KAW82_06895 [Desulfurellaceae bacterium]|nr:hypothetical protein [Desulfurellaceae bacterium]
MKTRELKNNSLILKEKIRQLLPGLEIEDIQAEVKMRDVRVDFLLTGNLKGKEYIFVCEVKSSSFPSHVLSTVTQLKKVISEYKNAYPIIIAPYISQRSAEICRENQVGFVDLEGNAFLSFDNILIDKRVKERTKVEKREVVEIFSPRATRIIRVLLENKKERWLITDLAKEANVSVGYTSNVLSALVNQGYVGREKRKGFQVKDMTALLDRWASIYDFSQNEIISLYTFEKDFGNLFKKINDVSDSLKLKCGLTLLSGASIVAPYIARFADIYLYIQGDIKIWKEKLDLREVEAGANFYLIIPYDEGIFYALNKVKGVPVVGNIQLYLDLIKYPARGKEQAEYLRNQLIKF